MEIHRHFLGWERPFTLDFARRLRAEAAGGGMDDWMVWVPSARAGRHILSELFSGEAEGTEAFHPPRILTPAQFERSLLHGPDCASEARRLLAWKTVLFQARLADLAPVFPVVPERQKHQWAFSLAGQLMQLRSRLLQDGFDFAGVAAARLENDRERWTALAGLERAYEDELGRGGLVDGESRFVKLLDAAIRKIPEKRLLVAGVLNLSKRQAGCIEAMLRAGMAVDLYLPLPEDEAETVDEWGRPRAESWERRSLPGSSLDGVIQRAPEPRQLVDSVLELAEVYSGQVDALVLGAPDAEMGRYLVERSRLTATPVYMPEGKALSATSWGRLLKLVLQSRGGASLQTLSELLRHSLFRKWAVRKGCRVEAVEKALVLLVKERLIIHTGQLQDPAFKPIHEIGIVREFLDLIDALFRGNGGGLSFAEGIWAVLQEVATGADLSEEARSVLDQLEEILQDMQMDLGPANVQEDDCWEILRYLMDASHYYPEREVQERPVSGWLELPWERAPHLVVLGLPDSKVPGSDGTDSFLTPALCRQLGIYGPEEAAAFHACRLRILIESRREWGKLDILLPDRGLDDDPEQASRFLFLADEEEILGRVELLMSEGHSAEETVPAHFGARLGLPQPPPLERISVTAFSAYLYSPLHYLMERSLGWAVPGELPVEMDALRFGSLAHRVIEQLNGTNTGAALSAPADVEAFLDDQLSTIMGEEFGRRLSVPAAIQESALRERLRAAARVIGGERQSGWKPVKAEWRFSGEINFQVEGVTLSGIVDLLERNEESGLYRIVDYKTSDNAIEAQAAHIGRLVATSPDPLFPEMDFVEDDKSWRWKDLQLVLYHQAVKLATGKDPVVAYLSLAKAVKEVRLSEWVPSEAQIAAGMKCAGAIIRLIRKGHFPAGRSIRYKEDWLPWFGGDYQTGLDAGWQARYMEGGA